MWILIAGLKEPPEDMLILLDIDIAAVGLDTRRELADALWHLLVTDWEIEIAFRFGEVCWRRNELGAGKTRQADECET